MRMERTLLTRMCGILLLLMLTPAFLGYAKEKDEEIAARVDGKTILVKEVNESAESDLFTAESEIYNIKKTHLDQMIADKILAGEARKHNKSLDELRGEIRKEAEAAVTDEKVKEFYEAHTFRFGGRMLEDVKGDVRQMLVEKEVYEKESKLVSELRKQHDIQIYLKEPSIEIDTAGQPTRGPKSARITLVEFSDFQCPYCAKFKDSVDQIWKEYPNDVRQVFRHNPLPNHPKAKSAHHASVCAQRQGKFWEYRDILFMHPQGLDDTSLQSYAAMLGLNMEEFDACMKDAEIDLGLDRDVEYAYSVGVRGTPTSFINGALVAGFRPYDQLKEIIEEKLNK